MALNLPTTSNTTGEFSNSVQAANLTSTAFTRDSKFLYANAQNENTGMGGVSISANGDYAIVGNRARKAGTSDVKKGFPYILTRSGNTWSTMTTLVVQTSANTDTTTEDHYGAWNDNIWSRNVSIDNDGLTVAITSSNLGTNSSAGRVEIWERSGSTWTFSAGFNGGSGDTLGYNGVRLSGDGTSLLAAGAGTIGRYTKSGGVWSQDFLNDAATGIGLDKDIDYNKAGTKFVHLNSSGNGNNNTNKTVKIHTSYWTGSAWANTTQTIDQTGYEASRSMALRMSGDGNYLAVQFDNNTSADGEGRLHIFVWDSANNDWDSQTVVSGKAGVPGWGRTPSFNNDGTKLLSGGNAQGNNPWIAFKRTGSTWTKEKETLWPQTGMTGNGLTEMSNDGYHLLLASPQTYWASGNYGQGDHQRGMVEYWVPTGVGVSSVSNGQIATHNGKRFRYNSAKQRWTPANRVNLTGVETTRTRSAGVASSDLSGETLSINGLTVDVGEFAGKTTTYANASIFPFSGLQAGDQAIALDTGYLYVTDGSGWFRVATSAIVT